MFAVGIHSLGRNIHQEYSTTSILLNKELIHLFEELHSLEGS
jgi:hypothetical protein